MHLVMLLSKATHTDTHFHYMKMLAFLETQNCDLSFTLKFELKKRHLLRNNNAVKRKLDIIHIKCSFEAVSFHSCHY